MEYLPGIFALLVGAAGWYYAFYSQAAEKLSSIEEASSNRLRIRLRRVGGIVIILLAGVFYAAVVMLQRERVVPFIVLSMLMLVLMVAILVLGLMDLRLTQKLRRERFNKNRL